MPPFVPECRWCRKPITDAIAVTDPASTRGSWRLVCGTCGEDALYGPTTGWVDVGV